MTQNDLNRSVAAATGETISDIAHFGFVPLTPSCQEYEPDDEQLECYLDWDEIDLHRNVQLLPQLSAAFLV